VEHRDIPAEDGIRFIYNDFANKTKGISQYKGNQHPDAVQTLLKTLADNRSLTVMQYDHLMKYLSQRREMQVKTEIGEEIPMQVDPIPATAAAPQQPEPKDKQKEMQQKILEALDKKKTLTEMVMKKTNDKPGLTLREELNKALLNNDSVKAAMALLLKKK
jgi:hypothetical protein